MTIDIYQKLIKLAYIEQLPENREQAEDMLQGGFFIPAEEMDNYLNDLSDGEVREFKAVAARDMNMHRCYFDLLIYIYNYLPKKFKSQIKKKDFYKWLKMLKKEYKVLFQFSDGSKFIEYESISFGRMDEHKFKAYVKEQLPFIYENVIKELFQESTANVIINNIEKEYEKFLIKLFAI